MFNEKLPLLPLYTNIYFDFHTPRLVNYFPNMEMSFPVALLHASYGTAWPEDSDFDDDIILIN
jgi:hypothetical protein